MELLVGNARETGSRGQRAQGRRPRREDPSNIAEGRGDEPDSEKAALYFEGLGAIQTSSFIYFVLPSDSKIATW